MSKFKNGIHPGVYTQVYTVGSSSITTLNRRTSDGFGTPDEKIEHPYREWLYRRAESCNFTEYFNETLVLPLALLL